jgi:hypothetical protein
MTITPRPWLPPATVALLALWTALPSPAAEPTTQPATQPAPRIIGSLKIETPGEWVMHTTLWTILTYQNPQRYEQPGPVYEYVVPSGIADYVWELLDPESSAVRYRYDVPGLPLVAPGPRGGRALPPPRPVPGGGEFTVFHRMLWRDDMPTAGTFLLRLTARVTVRASDPYAGTAYTGTTTAPLRIRDVTAAELPFLIGDPETRRGYLTAREAPAPPADPPASLLPTMGPEWLLRDLATRPIKTDVPDQGDMDKYFEWLIPVREQQVRNLDAAQIGVGLPPVYEPLVNLLRFEVLFRQAREPEATSVRQRTLKDHPGLAWLFDNAATPPAGGLIYNLRDNARLTGALDRKPIK